MQISSEPIVTAQFKIFFDKETFRSSIIFFDWAIATLKKDIPQHNRVSLEGLKTQQLPQVQVAYLDL